MQQILRAHDDGVWRSCVPSHLTASAMVLDSAGERVLLALHRKGGFWAQPGGHCEAADATLADAALREATEESGIDGLRLVGGGPVDLDRHQLSSAFGSCGEHLDVLLAFYDYPAEHWVHLRTTNPIESTFATVRLRQRVTKGPGSRAAGVAMAFKLIESAQARWRAVNAPHLVALVRAGATFKNGKLIERPDESGGDQQVA